MTTKHDESQQLTRSAKYTKMSQTSRACLALIPLALIVFPMIFAGTQRGLAREVRFWSVILDGVLAAVILVILAQQAFHDERQERRAALQLL